MSVEIVALLVLVAFFTLVLIEVPIGLSMIVAGAMGILLLDGSQNGTRAVSLTPYSATAKYSLFVVPMFVLLGALVANAGIGERIYHAVNRLVGRLPGGLAAATVFATTIFSGISGSSAADVATFGRIAVTQMRTHGYRAPYAAGIVAVAGTFAVLIPPNIGLVIYGILAGESIGALLLAGIVPGAISCLALVIFVVVKALLHPELHDSNRTPVPIAMPPRVANGEPPTPAATRAGMDFGGLVYAAILFVIVLGGIYTGVFTATEAGAVGAFAALVLAVIATRAMRGTSLRRVLVLSLRETSTVTSMIFLLLIGGSVLNYFVATSRLASRTAEWIGTLDVPALAVVGIFLLALVPMGMFLDGLSIMLLVVPLTAPVVVALGFDGVWFGILVIKMVEIGLITPPVGINVYIICGIVDDIRVEDVFRSVVPFVALDLALTALLFAFPGIVTWLPRLAGL